jgi:hypothetical protein
MRRGTLYVVLLAAALMAVFSAGGASAAKPTGSSLAVAKHTAHAAHKKKHKKKHKEASLTASVKVVGFGINHEFAADGATVSGSSACDAIVDSSYPVGPPQNVYIEAYMKATDIPSDAATQESFEFPQGEETDDEEPTLSPAAPWSQLFSPSTLGFGIPSGSQKDIVRAGLISYDDQDGPSASDFDGTYDFTVSVVVGPHTLTSTGTATVKC